jgi:membrane protease subunit HflK
MYNNVTKILVDTTKSNSLLYLPLDKIVSQVTAESAQAASAQTNQPGTSTPTGSVTVGGATSTSTSGLNTSTPASSSPADKRDGLRSRDREVR